MRISQLEGQRVALWGWGREGRAAHHAVRVRLPSLPLTPEKAFMYLHGPGQAGLSLPGMRLHAGACEAGMIKVGHEPDPLPPPWQVPIPAPWEPPA